MSRLTELFNRKDIHPVVLDVALFETFGMEWISWDADSVFMALERQVGSPVSRANKQKIYGLGVIHANHAYWEDWRAFEAVSWALSGKSVDLVQATPLSPIVLSYGYRVVGLLDNKPALSDEVRAYIVGVFVEDQYSLLPPEFSFLQEKLFELRPEARDRSGPVKSALLSSAKMADVTEISEDPVRVEVTRHTILSTVLNIICSPEYVRTQAEKFGLGNLVTKVLQGSRT